MAVARRGTSRLAAATGTTASVTRPSGTQTGDLLIVELGAQTATAFSAPGGWTQLINEQVNASTFRHGLFWRLDDGSAGPYSFTYGGASIFRWWRAVSYSGHDPANPINAANSQQTGGNSNTIVAPSLNTTVANCLLAYFGNPNGATSATWTPPSGMSAVDDIANGIFYAEQQLGAQGATGTRSGVVSASQHGVGSNVAIAPAVTPKSSAIPPSPSRGLTMR